MVATVGVMLGGECIWSCRELTYVVWTVNGSVKECDGETYMRGFVK